MAKEVSRVKYYDLKKAFNQLPKNIIKKFPEKVVEILPKVDFWEVKLVEQEKVVYSLFTELLNLSIWLPQEKIANLTKAILVDKIQYNYSSLVVVYYFSQCQYYQYILKRTLPLLFLIRKIL